MTLPVLLNYTNMRPIAKGKRGNYVFTDEEVQRILGSVTYKFTEVAPRIYFCHIPQSHARHLPQAGNAYRFTDDEGAIWRGPIIVGRYENFMDIFHK